MATERQLSSRVAMCPLHAVSLGSWMLGILRLWGGVDSPCSTLLSQPPTHSDHFPGLTPILFCAPHLHCFILVPALLPSFELCIVRILLTYITKIARAISAFRKSWIQVSPPAASESASPLRAPFLSVFFSVSMAPILLDVYLHCSATQSWDF